VGYLVYFNTNSNFTVFWILGALLTPLLVLKLLAVYIVITTMQVTVVWTLCLHSFLHLHFLSMCLCSFPFLQQYLQWKSSKYSINWDYVFILSYPTCNAHAPYYHLVPFCMYRTFPQYVLKGRILEEKVLNMKFYFEFLYSICLNDWIISDC
jgi:hypothetical protein